MQEVLIAVELTPETAEKIRFMVSEGVFQLNTGSAELHFKDGKLLKIVTHRIGYPHPPEIVSSQTNMV